LKLKTEIPVTLGVLAALLPVIVFRAPANTVRTGNELSALAWVLAKNRGEGSWELFPITVTVETGELVTFAIVENCGTVSRPDSMLPEEIPFPLDFKQTDGTVSIIFSEVP
jgi:hypothetical protein